MDGSEYAAELVRSRLAGALPARLTAIEARLELDAGALPAPKHVYAGERDRLAIGSDFPALLVVPQETLGAVEVDLNDRLDDDEPAAGPSYRVTYLVRVFTWAAVPDAGNRDPRGRQELVDLMRKRYTLAVRETLLAKLALGPGAKLEPWFRESYSDLAVDDRAKLTLAASYVDVRVELEEVVSDVPDTVYVPAGARTVHVLTEPLEDV